MDTNLTPEAQESIKELAETALILCESSICTASDRESCKTDNYMCAEIKQQAQAISDARAKLAVPDKEMVEEWAIILASNEGWDYRRDLFDVDDTKYPYKTRKHYKKLALNNLSQLTKYFKARQAKAVEEAKQRGIKTATTAYESTCEALIQATAQEEVGFLEGLLLCPGSDILPRVKARIQQLLPPTKEK